MIKKNCLFSKSDFIQHYFFRKKNSAGFTLIELLIVVAIIAILAVIVFVALDPLRRFQDSRDSVRWQEVTEIANAIKLYQVDHKGYYPDAIRNMASGSVYMIVDGPFASFCNSYNTDCVTDVDSNSTCVNLEDLVSSSTIGVIPISPNGRGAWGVSHTGYTLQRDYNNAIHVRACEAENSREIEAVR